jgi:SAM-dependent methyltransferase
MDVSSKRHYFNELAPRWDGLPSPPDAPTKVARFVTRTVRPGDRLILDAGCGAGVLLPALLRAADGAARIVESDVAERMLAENRRKFPGGPVERVCAEALRLPFPERAFDAVLCFGVLPHLGPAADALPRLWAHVKPGGVLAVGHLMGSDALNAFHAALEGPVNQDRLPPAAVLAGLFGELGGAVRAAEEAADWYYVAAERP